MKPCPCKDCETRKFLCHTFCENYQTWKAERTQVVEGLAEERAAARRIPDHQVRKIWANERYGRKRKQ